MRNLGYPIGKMALKVAGAALALATSSLVALPAVAAEFVFDLTKTSNTATQTFSQTGGSSDGNALNFTKTVGGTSLSLKVTGWSIYTGSTNSSFTNNRVYDSTLATWTGGIGVSNPWEPNPNDWDAVPEHSIDNNNGIDFVLLQFSQAVDLNSISIGWVYTDTRNPDADATVQWGDAPGAWNAVPVIDGRPVSALDALLADSYSSVPGSSTGTRNVNGTGNVMSDFWIVSAANPNPNDGTSWNPKTYKDYLKLSQISVSFIPPVPEPGTWMMMIVGFGAIGGMMRRSRRPAGLAMAGA